MQTIELSTTRRRTTRLGYGCSSLMGAMGRRESVALLDASYEAGIRHFDVAPMYGFGQAESCVGEFLGRHRADVTVTTKYGIAPPRRGRMISVARSVARPVLRILPGLKKGMLQMASKSAAPAARAKFSAEEARGSLERSLRELKTERIDVWLLHEATVYDLQDEGLLRMLEDAVAAGTIGAFGVGSERSRTEELQTRRPEYCGVVQCEWSVLDAPMPSARSFRIHHRALTENFRSLHAELAGDRAKAERWSRETGVNCADPEMLASLMLKAALEENPLGMVLFSSKQAPHMRRNVAVAEDRALAAPARRFYESVQRERIGHTIPRAAVAG